MAFFDCHRKIVFREAEGNLWSHIESKNGTQPELSDYAIPMASEDEILIEKTPHIINRGYDLLKYRAELMKKTIEGVKVLVMLCDPIKRFISMEKHHTPKNWDPTPRDELTVNNTRKHIRAFMKYENNTKSNAIIRPTAKELAVEMNDEKWPKIKGLTHEEIVNLRYGNFYQQLLPFYEVFGHEGMIFLDGTNMGMIYYQ